MWNEKVLKVIPAVVFLFCLLEIFELVLIINDMNKTEKLEAKIENNLKVLESITILLNRDLECMELEHPKDKGIKIK
ncbi:hypothetical protein ACEN77_07995 [Helicobacter pylori]|uniref:hypothetical protein n=1 Tax=Helicobacter pylori TaxID=210 RepID=UPI003570AD3A